MIIGPGLPLALLVGLVHTAVYVLIRGDAGGRLPLTYAAAALGAWAGAAIGGQLGITFLAIGDFALIPASHRARGWGSGSWRSSRHWGRSRERQADDGRPDGRARVAGRVAAGPAPGGLEDLADLLGGDSDRSRRFLGGADRGCPGRRGGGRQRAAAATRRTLRGRR